MSENVIDDKLLIVTSAPGGRDTIYVGFAKRWGDMLALSRASMIVRYVEVGVPGLSSQPEKAIRLRPVAVPGGEVFIPICSVAAMVQADPDAWESHLGVSRG